MKYDFDDLRAAGFWITFAVAPVIAWAAVIWLLVARAV